MADQGLNSDNGAHLVQVTVTSPDNFTSPIESTSRHQEPQDATATALSKQSGLHLGGEEVQILMPSSLKQTAEDDAEDYTGMIESFNLRLSETKKAGEVLEACRKGERRRSDSHIQLKQDKYSCAEWTDYKEKCEKLVERGKQMKEAYNSRLEKLEREIVDMKDMKQIHNKEHQLEMDKIKRECNEEVSGLKDAIQTHTEYQELLQQMVQDKEFKVSRLEQLKETYKKQSNEVEKLRTNLASKEKSLNDLHKTIEKLERELGNLKRNDRRDIMVIIHKKENTKEQLKRCQQIEELISHLPDVNGTQEREKLIAEISEEAAKMKASSMNKRSTSWKKPMKITRLATTTNMILVVFHMIQA